LRLRALALLAALFSLAVLTACGDDDEGGDAQALKITVSDKGKNQSTIKAAPTSVEAGLVEFSLQNNGKRPHDAQMFRVAGNQSAAQTIAAVGKLLQGQGGFPEWLTAGGGIGATRPGQTQTVQQVLEPGTYYIGDIEGTSGPPDPKTTPKLVVSGEQPDAELPETEGTITAREYLFESEGLTAGKNEVLFDNAGAQPHHVIAAQIKPGFTIEDVRKFAKTEKGKPPIDEQGSVVSAVLEGQTSQVVTLDLPKPGKYALLCFISDRQGGPPHALKGMISEATVE
jgi:hypothetical protein